MSVHARLDEVVLVNLIQAKEMWHRRARVRVCTVIPHVISMYGFDS